MSPVENGETSGTTGKSLALGGIKVNLPDKGYAGTIQYMSHIQDIGWDSWKEEGEVSGTANGQKRLEAVKIRLTEEMEERYDIYYRVHAQNFGWMGWAKNGEAAGTEGYGYRVEAIQIKIVKKVHRLREQRNSASVKNGPPSSILLMYRILAGRIM